MSVATKPFVSKRKWIKWGKNLPFENTDTLVLTSAAKSFVDIRIFKSPNGSLPNDPTDNTSIQRLEWGFAGTSNSTSISQTSTEDGPTSHTVWTHWVDSKVPIGQEVQDEGDMYAVEDSADVLEKGAMANPVTGRVENYEELWEDLKIGKREGEEQFVSWVMRTEGDEGEVRGMIIRIGGWVQGVLRKGEEVSVTRLEAGRDGRWERVVVIGDLNLSGLMMINEEFEVDKCFTGKDGLLWMCTESNKWT